MNNNFKKVYCVLWDTMPLTEGIIKIAKKNNLSILSQIGGCFTMTSISELFTGRMPSDLVDGGMGHLSLEKYRDKNSKKIFVPWDNEYITSELYKNYNWNIHLHGIPPNVYIHGNINTDSYEGGYESRYQRVKDNKKPSYSGKMMDGILIGSSSKSRKWQEREIEFIKNLPYDNVSKNTFYFIEYEHYHSFPSYTKHIDKNEKEKYRRQVEKRIKELISSWDFNEPNTLFWFFGDHGDQEKTNKLPKAESYLSWAIFKDNIQKNKIVPQKTIISMRDFKSTIMEKFEYEYPIIKENESIYTDIDKNRIYFVEDGREKLDKLKSTTAIACVVIGWYKNGRPRKLLQVGYFRMNQKYYYHINRLDEYGRYKSHKKIDKNDKDYKPLIKELENKLREKFKWTKEDGL